MEKVEEELPDYEFAKLPVCENFLNLSFIGLMLGFFLLFPEHIIDLCLMYLKCFSCKIEKRSIRVSLAKEFGLAFRQVVAVANDFWVKPKHKRWQEPNFGILMQRNPKDFVAGTYIKDTNCLEQGSHRKGKIPTPDTMNLKEGWFNLVLDPPMQILVWQVWLFILI